MSGFGLTAGRPHPMSGCHIGGFVGVGRGVVGFGVDGRRVRGDVVGDGGGSVVIGGSGGLGGRGTFCMVLSGQSRLAEVQL